MLRTFRTDRTGAIEVLFLVSGETKTIESFSSEPRDL